MDLSVKCLGHDFKTPLLPASGPLTSTKENLMFFEKNKAGAIVTKTISVQGAEVKKPCIYGDNHMVYNAETWSEQPLEYWVEKILPEIKNNKTKPLIISTGYSPQDLKETIPALDAFADIFEISTHYVKEDLTDLVKTIKQQTNKPVLIKLSPHIQDYLSFVEQVITAGADGIVAINSVGPAVKINLKNKKIKLGNEKGETWLSGPAIKPYGLQRIMSIRKHFPDIPLIAVGGVASAEDVIEYILAGADLVQMLSHALIHGKSSYDKIINRLDQTLKDYGFNAIADVRHLTLKENQFREHNFPIIDYSKCIECQLCVDVCPVFAINFTDKIHFIHEKCIRCGLCESRCPKNAISGVF